MNLSPDEIVFWQSGPVQINATLLFTWLLMALMVLGSKFATRRLSTDAAISPLQNLLEVLISGLDKQITEISQRKAQPYLPFVGTLFLFIFIANVLAVVPGYRPPTASLSTTLALAVCVFMAVPFFGIAEQGIGKYLLHYVRPTILMLPFNLIGELSRTFALAVRLYGNVMSGTIIVAILLSIAPFLFPVLLQLLGLLTGVIQAYIFAVLAMIYIASASQAHEPYRGEPSSTKPGKNQTIGEVK